MNKISKFVRTVFVAAAITSTVMPTTGGVPEPDNILFGTIIVNGSLITSDRSEFVIEARRSPQGPAIASYRMGDRASVGNNYSLRLAMESSAPLANSNAILVNDLIYLTVTDNTGDLTQSPFFVTDRGGNLRIDFILGDLDSDADGLPDTWENARFGNLNATGTGDNDGDALTNSQEFIAGTNPMDPGSILAVNVSKNGSQTTVSFDTIAASGAGYEGRTRRYTLQESSLLDNDWQTVSGWTDILGTGQPVAYQPAEGGAPKFYRASVRLFP